MTSSPTRRPHIPGLCRIFQEAHVDLREAEESINELRFQLANAIITQIVDQLKTEMGSTNPMEDEEPPTDISPPAEPF